MNNDFYTQWMSYIKDDAKLRDIAIPGSHDAGTYEMMRFARCQSDNFYEQYKHGIRYFDTRFHIGLKGKLVFEHGILGGTDFEEGLLDIKHMMENNDSEFFIFKLYHPKTEYVIGKLGRRYPQNLDYVNEILEKYIQPSKYAFTDFDDITKVTMEDIRKSGKRYLINWTESGINGAVNAPVADPWRPDYYGMRIDKFFLNTLKFYEEIPDKSLFCHFIQRTPGIGTEEGLKNPDTLERDVKMNFSKLIDTIGGNEELLKKSNIFTGDFMTDGHYKVNMILKLNLLKNTVKEENRELFTEVTKV